MRIQYNYYTLESCTPPALARMGALLRIEFQDGIIGYADCHPWPELGDKSIQDQLKTLLLRHPSSLMRRSLHFARIDGEARSKKESLFKDVTIPASHYLIPNLLSWSPKGIEGLIEQGITHIKIKMGNSLSQEIGALLKLFPSNTSFKLRLDFNEKLSLNEFHAFIKAIDKLLPAIDFIEDPLPFDPMQWEKIQKSYSIDLACDRQCSSGMLWPESAAVLVVKPAVESIELFERVLNEKVIITSYLDHPLGQLSAAYVASKMDPKNKKIHGLLTHYTYQPNNFSIAFNNHGKHLVAPGGTGFGFDEQLNEILWKDLIA
ncbi:MAG: hypothetical protein H0W88_08305 [Parachlamydiaceae bacterium]|nr:hypothetical protein [Parachlamydiaceae bacterium]